ncbi:hypothetical protein [Saccharothrix texasensis]|uniref:hypothetical protein n=1 Tax=Saccharothrix texasensis TaxID=103734 RepID=UPI000F4C6E07|nr:hypothetical protein [Saccharothrix texasensis]
MPAAATPPSSADPNVRINGNAALAAPTAAITNSSGTGCGKGPSAAQVSISAHTIANPARSPTRRP